MIKNIIQIISSAITGSIGLSLIIAAFSISPFGSGLLIFAVGIALLVCSWIAWDHAWENMFEIKGK